MIDWFSNLTVVEKVGWSVLGLIILGFIIAVFYFGLRRIPTWRNLQNLEIEKRVSLKIDIIKTVASILGGLFFLATLYFTWQNLIVSQEKHKTDLFVKAIEQLGSEKLEVKLGGIYALERIARDSEKDHWTIMEVLTAYVRANAPWPPEEPADAQKKRPWAKNRPGEKPKEKGEPEPGKVETTEQLRIPTLDSDIQAVLTVIGRRSRTFGKDEAQPLDLTSTDLRKANLRGVHLEGADLQYANLGEADLREAHLEGTKLNHAHLEGANFTKALMEGAWLWEAHLEGADLRSAHLEKAVLTGAHLKGAYCDEAHLQKAMLYRANMEGSYFQNSHLEGAYLKSAHLEGANLRDAHLEGADLGGAYLERVTLQGAHLKGAMLMAHLDRADLSNAHLEGAWLRDTRMEGVWLGGANLKIARLEGADLSGAKGLTELQIRQAYIDEKTKLPDYLKHLEKSASPKQEKE